MYGTWRTDGNKPCQKFRARGIDAWAQDISRELQTPGTSIYGTVVVLVHGDPIAPDVTPWPPDPKAPKAEGKISGKRHATVSVHIGR